MGELIKELNKSFKNELDYCLFCYIETNVKIKLLLVKGDIKRCPNCGEFFSVEVQYRNPDDCIHCGYKADCEISFEYCPFDSKKTEEKREDVKRHYEMLFSKKYPIEIEIVDEVEVS